MKIKKLMEMVWHRKGCQDPVNLAKWFIKMNKIFGSSNHDEAEE